MRLTTFSKNKFYIAFSIILFIQLIIANTAFAASKTVATVGSASVTEYDVKIRSNFLLIVKNKSTNSRNRANIRKSTIKTLTSEQVQIQAAAKAGIQAANGEVNRRVASIAKGARMSVNQLAKFLKSKGSNISTMKDMQKAGILWGGLVRAKFGASAQVSEKLIDDEAEKLGKRFGGKQTVYDLRRILLQMPSNANRAKRNKRLADAKTVRENFTKCSRVRSLTSSLGRVKIENKPNTSLGNLSSGARKLVRNTKVGAVSKGRVIKGAVELYAVCKKTTARTEKARKYIENKLVQKKFEKFAGGYLDTLRSEYNVQVR